MPYFVESHKRSSHWINLKFENCEISSAGATELLRTLSTLKRPLKSLSIAENYLGWYVLSNLRVIRIQKFQQLELLMQPGSSSSGQIYGIISRGT